MLSVVLPLFFALSIAGQTRVSISGTKWLVNGRPTFEGKRAEGLLMNQRMVNGIFDDANKSTIHNWHYPDTHKWDPERNVNEFVSNFSNYMSHGMNAFTVGLQGGCPYTYCRNHPQHWIVTAFDPATGNLDAKWFGRLTKVLTRADQLGMVVIVQAFYPAQARRMQSATAIKNAVRELVKALSGLNLSNFILEIGNECNAMPSSNGGILRPDGIIQLIKQAQTDSNGKILVGTSFTSGQNPDDSVIDASDYILLHGNGKSSSGIQTKIDEIRASSAYKKKNKPIVFNEDDAYDFSNSNSHFQVCLKNKVSWGLLINCENSAGDYKTGYQCPPTNWGISATSLKKQYYDAVKSVTH